MTAYKKMKIRKNVTGYLYVLPVILGVLFFTLLPVVYAFINSFFETPLKPFSLKDWGVFVGFKNYYQNFTNGYYRRRFLRSLGVTFSYAGIYIPLSLVLSFLLAVLLNKNVKGIRFFRVLYYLPVLIPAVCDGRKHGKDRRRIRFGRRHARKDRAESSAVVSDGEIEYAVFRVRKPFHDRRKHDIVACPA